MANELSITGSISYTNSAAPLYQAAKQLSIQDDALGKKYTANTQIIGSGGEENLDKSGDITTVGWVIAKNLDGSNTITLGTTATQRPVNLPPGGICVWYANASEVIAQAGGGSPIIEYLLIEA